MAERREFCKRCCVGFAFVSERSELISTHNEKAPHTLWCGAGLLQAAELELRFDQAGDAVRCALPLPHQGRLS